MSTAVGAEGDPLHVEVLVPTLGTQPLATVLEGIALAEPVLPFHEERLAFMADLSRDLRIRARGIPEIEALAFWMRPAEVTRLSQYFDGLGDERTLLMPRGTVFHIPPANVDTIFVYSLALSLLTGNRNVVRLSARAVEAARPILDSINAVAAAHERVADSLRIVTYGHDDQANAALTAACDVRVVWGGDSTIAAFRLFPLPPHATELAFADRFSMAAIKTESYQALSEEERTKVAERFVNDTYWFDQLGCSSARLITWVGNGEIGDVAEDFHARVRERVASKGFVVDTAAAMGKIGQAFRSMIDGDVTGYRWYDNTEVVLDSGSFPPARGEFCGAGLFYQWGVPDLAALAPHIRREDQTLAVFGFSDDELRAFATGLCGRGIDRIVPIGQALNFNRTWDGNDLVQSFTRRVFVSAR